MRKIRQHRPVRLWLVIIGLGAAVAPAPAQWPADVLQSDGDAGSLGRGWSATHPGSFDTRGFGLADGPVTGAFDCISLPDGRAAIACEQWTALDARRARLQIVTRVLGERGWAPLASPLDLEPEPIAIEPSMRRTWRRAPLLLGPHRRVQTLTLTALPTGTLQLTILHASRDNHRHIQAWQLGPERTWALVLDAVVQLEPGSQRESALEVAADGTVYLLSRVILLQPGGPAQFRLSLHRAANGKLVRLPFDPPAEQLAHFRPREHARLLVDGPFPVLAWAGIRGGRPAPSGFNAVQYWRWQADRQTWSLLWAEPAEQEQADRYGLPAAQRPDGLPVWVWNRPLPPEQGSFAYEPCFVETGPEGPLEQPLPPLRPGTRTDLWGRAARVHYLGHTPVLVSPVVSRVVRRGVPVPDQHRLHAVAWARVDEAWLLLGGVAYTRRFHGGHDGITAARAAVDPRGNAVLVWGNALPIHGPFCLFAARWTGGWPTAPH